jgi:preprotein translocase subunit YajC
MGTYILAASTTTTKSGGSSELLLLAVIFAVMIIFMMRSSRRRKAMAQNTQNNLVDGVEVRTTFGVFGKVVDADDTPSSTVTIEIAPGVKIKILRQAIAAVIPPETVEDTFPESPDGAFQTVPDLDSDDASGPSDNRGDKSN